MKSIYVGGGLSKDCTKIVWVKNLALAAEQGAMPSPPQPAKFFRTDLGSKILKKHSNSIRSALRNFML